MVVRGYFQALTETRPPEMAYSVSSQMGDAIDPMSQTIGSDVYNANGNFEPGLKNPESSEAIFEEPFGENFESTNTFNVKSNTADSDSRELAADNAVKDKNVSEKSMLYRDAILSSSKNMFISEDAGKGRSNENTVSNEFNAPAEEFTAKDKTISKNKSGRKEPVERDGDFSTDGFSDVFENKARPGEFLPREEKSVEFIKSRESSKPINTDSNDALIQDQNGNKNTGENLARVSRTKDVFDTSAMRDEQYKPAINNAQDDEKYIIHGEADGAIDKKNTQKQNSKNGVLKTAGGNAASFQSNHDRYSWQENAYGNNQRSAGIKNLKEQSNIKVGTQAARPDVHVSIGSIELIIENEIPAPERSAPREMENPERQSSRLRRRFLRV